MSFPKRMLAVSGVFTLLAAVLHVAIILGGPDWYRFFGAGEEMAKLAEQGSGFPPMVTGIIALVLAIWGLYGLSGSGYIPPLPFLNVVILMISAVFLLRGLGALPLVLISDDPYMQELRSKMTFMLISSVVCLLIGLCYLLGGFYLLRQEKTIH